MWVTNTTQTQLFLTPPPPPITFFFPVTLSEILIFSILILSSTRSFDSEMMNTITIYNIVYLYTFTVVQLDTVLTISERDCYPCVGYTS